MRARRHNDFPGPNRVRGIYLEMFINQTRDSQIRSRGVPRPQYRAKRSFVGFSRSVCQKQHRFLAAPMPTAIGVSFQHEITLPPLNLGASPTRLMNVKILEPYEKLPGVSRSTILFRVCANRQSGSPGGAVSERR